MSEQVTTPRDDKARPFDQHYTLCYKTHPISNFWQCESGYKSIEAADIRAMEIKVQYSEVITALFPYKYCTPNVVQRIGIRAQLIPKVTIVSNKEQK